MTVNVTPPTGYDHPPPPPPPIPAEVRPRFYGRTGAFCRIAIVGALLELVTFGFYRFWLATNIRRHLWSNTVVDGEPFEYTGRGRELLIGFLFALAILVPIYFLYFLAGVEAERRYSFASFPLLIFVYAFGQFAAYRARRYRLTRTTWKGIRFWMDGSGFGYAWRACLWGALVYLTLGLALPWREAALERYKMRHTYYGDLQGSFAATGWEFFKRGWWLWLLAWAPLVLFIALVIGGAVMRDMSGTRSGKEAFEVVLGLLSTPMFFIFPAIPFIYAAFKAMEWRWWASGLRFGKLSVTSDLENHALFASYWAAIGFTVLIFIVFLIVVGIAIAVVVAVVGESHLNYAFKHLAQGSPLAFVLIGGYVASYFAMLLAVGTVMRIVIMRGVWQKVVSSLTVHGIAAADAVTARGEAANALGEGFADSLDIAGF